MSEEWKQPRGRLTWVHDPTPSWRWQWAYVEAWADGSGIYERVTFYTSEGATKYLEDNAEGVESFNKDLKKKDRLVARIERRMIYEPSPWEAP